MPLIDSRPGRKTVATAVFLTGGALVAAQWPDLRPLIARVSHAVSYRASVTAGAFRAGTPSLVEQPGDVTFTVTTASTFPISPLIYGANFLTDDDAPPPGVVEGPWAGARLPAGMTLNRVGGNRLSAYNWRLNVSNAGQDYRYQNDRYLSASSEAGAAVRSRLDATRKRGAALLVTVPMLPFVAGNANAVPLDTSEATADYRLSKDFVPNRATRGPRDVPGTVYQDEFVRWLGEVAIRSGAVATSSPLLISLDNEPDIWQDTHQEIMSRVSGRPALQTYDGFVSTSLDYARAIKRQLPSALIFGPAVATYAGMLTLGRHPAPDPKHGTRPFLEYYLERMRAADAQSGIRLLDVLDVHWYPSAGTTGGEITNDFAPQTAEMIEKRLQAPRSLWDPTYNEGSWVTLAAWGPIALVPRLRRMITQFYPGTKIAITEYYYGRGGDISGGLAQADVLGIFGREGVFAAALWPQAGIWSAPYLGSGARAYAYAFGAIRLFRNYDGNGATFGDIGVQATTTHPISTSVYASRDKTGRLVLVAINKSGDSVHATLAIPGMTPRLATIWAMQHGAAVPTRLADVTTVPGEAMTLVLPPMSASTVVVVP